MIEFRQYWTTSCSFGILGLDYVVAWFWWNDVVCVGSMVTQFVRVNSRASVSWVVVLVGSVL